MRGHPFDDVRYTAPIWTDNQNSLQDNWTDIGVQASNTNTLIIQEESRMKLAGHNVLFDTPETVTFPVTHNACIFTIYLIIDAINKTYSLDVSPSFPGDNGNLATTYNVAFMTYEHGGGSVMINANNVVKLYATDTPNIWQNDLNYDSTTKVMTSTVNGVTSNGVTIEAAGVPQNLQQTLNLGSTGVEPGTIYIGSSTNAGFTPDNGVEGNYFRSDITKAEIGGTHSGSLARVGAGNSVFGSGGPEAYCVVGNVGIVVKNGSAHYIKGSITSGNEIATLSTVYLATIEYLELKLGILKQAATKYPEKKTLINAEMTAYKDEIKKVKQKIKAGEKQ